MPSNGRTVRLLINCRIEFAKRNDIIQTPAIGIFAIWLLKPGRLRTQKILVKKLSYADDLFNFDVD
jgi:hypothetical protein